jgi:hypothetical protein
MAGQRNIIAQSVINSRLAAIGIKAQPTVSCITPHARVSDQDKLPGSKLDNAHRTDVCFPMDDRSSEALEKNVCDRTAQPQ